MTVHILVTDDDHKLRELLKQYLEKEGFAVTTAANSLEAEKELSNQNFDVLVLDVMMPQESGVEFAIRLREKSNIPILMLTAMSEAQDRIKGLESGVNDYLTKPFEPRELSLRLKNLTQKPTFKQSSKVTFGNYEFDIENGDLKKDDEYIDLSSTESYLLKTLAKSANKAISREQISQELNNISERSIDVQIARLRRKIEIDPKKPDYIHTERSKGYSLRTRS